MSAMLAASPVARPPSLGEPEETRTRGCANPGCHNLVAEPWEESGLFCAKCTIEMELYDRQARWERLSRIQ